MALTNALCAELMEKTTVRVVHSDSMVESLCDVDRALRSKFPSVHRDRSQKDEPAREQGHASHDRDRERQPVHGLRQVVEDVPQIPSRALLASFGLGYDLTPEKPLSLASGVGALAGRP